MFAGMLRFTRLTHSQPGRGDTGAEEPSRLRRQPGSAGFRDPQEGEFVRESWVYLFAVLFPFSTI